MVDPNKIESLIAQAVSDVLNTVMPELREQLARRVMDQIRPELSADTGGSAIGTPDSSRLNRAMATIQAGTTQVQILDAMVEGAAAFTGRTALYVVRGANAVGWRARGFHDDEAVRNTPLELSLGLAAKAINERTITNGSAEEFIPGFGQKFGAPLQEALACPLIVRDKVVALIYADGGSDSHRMDRPALESLVRMTGMWLEVFATRKATPTSPAAEHPPQMMAAAAAVAPPPQPVSAPEPPAEPASAPEAPAPEVQATPVPRSADDEVHKKAKRFAKLLVDEIKLYNQAKVAEGREHKDLYDRLKDDIEKSRASYDKRYGGTVAKESNYFDQELIRILADNDASRLGGNFSR